jgi:hypothetical protein
MLRAAQTMQMAGELHRIMAALEADAIDVMAFKGPVLSAFAYEDLGRLLSGDLDIVVRPSQRSAAAASLATLGYLAEEGYPPHFFEGDNELVLRAPGRTEVDLHWALSPVYWMRFDLDQAFSRSQFVHLIGHRFRTLGTEDMLLGLAIHHGRHCWERPAHVEDIVRLLRRHEIDWSLLADLAQAAGAQRVLLLALLLAERSAPGLVPAPALRRAQGDRNLQVAIATIERNFTLRPDDFAGTLPGASLQLRLCDTWADRWRYVSGRGLKYSRRDSLHSGLGRQRRPGGSLCRLVRVTSKILRHG